MTILVLFFSSGRGSTKHWKLHDYHVINMQSKRVEPYQNTCASLSVCIRVQLGLDFFSTCIWVGLVFLCEPERNHNRFYKIEPSGPTKHSLMGKEW